MVVLKEAVNAILTKLPELQEAKDYYDGSISETFASRKLRIKMQATINNMGLNFSRAVVNAVADRMEISNIQGTTKAATDTINKVWSDNDLAVEAKDLHNWALVYGEAYAAVWPDENGDIQVSYNSPETMAIVYDKENPRVKAYAVKIWQSAENEHRMNLYYKDKIVKYRVSTGNLTDAVQWNLVDTIDNPWNEVPVFHFRTGRPHGRPEHKDAYDPQQAINKLFVTSMFTTDYMGAPQRWALSGGARTDGAGAAAEDFADDDTARENVGALRNGPGEMWFLNGVDKVGQFDAAEPSAFWDPIKDSARAMASLTDTPLHYFERTGNNPTGNGLRVAEAPLLKKVADRETAFGLAWRDLFRFVLKIEGIKADVSVYWKAHESLDELERWDLALKKINAGLSHRQALLEGGYSPEEVDRIMQERQFEADNGLFYSRIAQTRVNTNKDETQSVQTGDTTNGN